MTNTYIVGNIGQRFGGNCAIKSAVSIEEFQFQYEGNSFTKTSEKYLLINFNFCSVLNEIQARKSEPYKAAESCKKTCAK